MVKALALVVLLAGCIVEETATDEQDVHGDTDGFGYWCDNPAPGPGDPLGNPCYTVNGTEGMCDCGVCRRYCTSSLGGCPKHFHHEFVLGDNCLCVPNLRPEEFGDLAPAMNEVPNPYPGL